MLLLHFNYPESLSLPCSYVQPAQLTLISQLLRNLFFNPRFLFVPFPHFHSALFCLPTEQIVAYFSPEQGTSTLHCNIATLQHCNDSTSPLIYHLRGLKQEHFLSQFISTQKNCHLQFEQCNYICHLRPSLFNWVLSFRYFDPFPRCAAKMHVMAQIAQHNNNSLSPFN